MNINDLVQELTRFLSSRQAILLCQRYHSEPSEALGELFLRLKPRIAQPIRTPKAWVEVNARGYLRNYLRRECTPLQQGKEKIQ